MRSTLRTALLLVSLLAPAAAFAADVTDSPGEILQAQRTLRHKFDNPSSEYSKFAPDALKRMRDAQDRIFALLSGVRSIDQLDADKQAALATALNEVKTTLAANDGDRLVCRRETKMGTNISEKRCETVASREARARESQRDVGDMAQQGQYNSKSGN